MTFLLSALRFWREGLIALLIAGVWYFHSDANFYKTKYDLVQDSFNTSQSDLKAARGKIFLFEQTFDEGQKAQAVAEQKRMVVISNLTNQIGALRKQEPPKECTAAIDWAIQNKDQLQWTK